VGTATARMMTWRAWAMVPTVLPLALGFLPLAISLGDGLSAAVRVVSLAVLLWAVPLWLALVGAVFRTGQRAFGLRAGVGYAVLTLVLTFLFGLGVFTVPLMVRADIQRLLGGALPDEASDITAMEKDCLLAGADGEVDGRPDTDHGSEGVPPPAAPVSSWSRVGTPGTCSGRNRS